MPFNGHCHNALYSYISKDFPYILNFDHISLLTYFTVSSASVSSNRRQIKFVWSPKQTLWKLEISELIDLVLITLQLDARKPWDLRPNGRANHSSSHSVTTAVIFFRDFLEFLFLKKYFEIFFLKFFYRIFF